MTLAGSPALDLVIASLTGRGRARFGRRLKNFQKFPGLLLTFCKRLPTSYLPHLTSTSHPPLPTQYYPVHSESVVLFISLRKSLFLRPEEEVSST